MKKLILILIISVFTFNVNAQSRLKVSEEHGDVFKLKGVGFLDVFKSSGGGYWSISYKYEGGGIGGRGFLRGKTVYYAQSYDEDMNLINQKRLEFTKAGKNLRLEKIVKFNRDYYVFLSFDNAKKKKRYLFYSRLDNIDLRLDSDLVKIAEVKIADGEKGYSSPDFDISVSDNEKFLVVFGKDAKKLKRPKRKGLFSRLRAGSTSSSVGTHNFKFTYWVLDKKLEIVNYEKNHSVKVRESTDKFYVRDYTVDDKGAIYILGKNAVVDDLTRREAKKKKTWVDIKKSAFVLEKINPDGTSEQQVTPEGTLFVDMDILFDKDGNVNLLGLNGEQVYYKLATTGVTRLVYDNEDLSNISEVTAELDEEVLKNVNDMQVREQSMNKRQKKRKKRKEKKLSPEQKAFNKIAERAALNANFIAYSGLDDNGDAIIILEEQHLEVVTTTYRDANGNTHTTTTYYYHYDDLIMTKFIEDDVVQNYYKKSFVSVNTPLQKSMDVSLKDGEISIMTQGHIVRTDYDLEKVKDYKLQAFSRKDRIPGMRRKGFTYRKTVDESTILAPAQFKKKVAWYKIKIK